jgi:hypothetical protein
VQVSLLTDGEDGARSHRALDAAHLDSSTLVLCPASTHSEKSCAAPEISSIR